MNDKSQASQTIIIDTVALAGKKTPLAKDLLHFIHVQEVEGGNSSTLDFI